MESTIYTYLRHHATELGARILEMHPPLQAASDPTPESLKELLRSPLPAQAVAIGGLAKYLQTGKAARIVGECGTGKTYMALALAHVLAAGGRTQRWSCALRTSRRSGHAKRSRRFRLHGPS